MNLIIKNKFYCSNRLTLAIFSIAAIAQLLCSGCSLDSQYYEQRKTDSYTLGFNIIPQSQVDVNVSFTSNGNLIYGVFIKALNRTANTPTILYFHGNDKDIEKYWARMEKLYPLGTNIFIFDYQGYGKSTGSPSLSAIQQNSIDALTYLKTRAEVNPNKIIYYGFSLGGVFELRLAAQTFQPAAAIGEALPASTDALAHTVLRTSVPSEDFFDETFDNVAMIKQLRAPVLLFHGTKDEKLPFHENADPLFDAALQPKTTVAVEGSLHDQVIDTLGQAQYLSIIQNFLQQNKVE